MSVYIIELVLNLHQFSQYRVVFILLFLLCEHPVPYYHMEDFSNTKSRFLHQVRPLPHRGGRDWERDSPPP